MSNIRIETENTLRALTGFLASIETFVEDAKSQMSDEDKKKFEKEFPNVKEKINKSLSDLSKAATQFHDLK